MWADRSLDPESGGFFEQLDQTGAPVPGLGLRGRVAPRQLYAFARVRALGWNPDGAADRVIDHALAFLDGPGRSPRGGWAHRIAPDGRIIDERRDLYDHAFVALAGAGLAALGDRRGEELADEAFGLIDTVFADPDGRGWFDPELAPGVRLANPHMHLLEACLAHHDATGSMPSLQRAERIAALFERHMFDADTGAMSETFGADWSAAPERAVEPGHCHEWAFLLGELERASGRDTASWRRRLVAFAERAGLSNGLAVDLVGAPRPSCRLWPQLERIRALVHIAPERDDLDALVERIFDLYLDHGAPGVWRDQIDPSGETLNPNAPASMVYHFITAFAPLTLPGAARKG